MKKRRILSVALTVCLCMSADPMVYAQGNAFSQAVNEEVSDTEPAAYAGRDETGAVSPLTYENVYDAMIALKNTYPEGLYWTNYTPYGRDGDKDMYRWHGGGLGRNLAGGVGCAAFAFILSDEAFGNLPGRIETIENYTYDNIRPGDILRVDNNSHFVIVLQKSTGGVVVAEGNYNKSVHWGRALSKDEVMRATFVVTRYPTSYIPPDASDANVVENSGTEGSLNWTLTKAGTLTISGSGAISDYSPNDNNLPSWNKCADKINTIVIGNGVTSIGNYAFYQSNALSVYLPNGITKIGNSAFQKSKIISITLPDTVQTIGDDVFRECENLTSASISDGLTSIGQRAFHSCTQLEYIDFPASVTEVGAGAFMSCSEMVRARFAPSENVVKVGDGLFTQCWHLSDLTLPVKIDRISSYMFQSCTSLASIYIPEDVTEIGENPFVSTGIQHGGTISFGGSKAAWINKGGQFILNAMPYAKIDYNVPFVDPFAQEPGTNDMMLEHSWDTEWTHSSTHHWHECTIEGCIIENAAEKNGYAEHSFDSNHTCIDCGYTKISTSHTHSWATKWTHNDSHHWHECITEGCDIENTADKDGYAEHNLGEGEPGSGRTCECGYSEVTLKPEHEHQWATEWKTNETCHWHECLAEDCTAAANSEKEGHGDHDFSEDNGNTCSICKYKKSNDTQAPGSNSGSPSSGSSSSSGSGSSNPGTTTPNQPTTVTETTTRPDGTQVTVETTTGTDGSETQKTTEVKTDGSITETTVITNADGSKTETSVTTNADGSKTETSAATNTDGSRLETSIETAADGTVTKETVTDVATDGSATKTEDTKVVNTKGTEIEVTTVTKIDPAGNVTDITEKSNFTSENNQEFSVTVKKDNDNQVLTAKASVTNTVADNKVALTADAVAQIAEAAGQDDVAITITAKMDNGDIAYQMTVNASNLKADEDLYVYAYNKKTKEYTVVNAKTYKMTESGLTVSLENNKANEIYRLVNSKRSNSITKAILKTVKTAKASVSVKKGKKTKIALSSKLNQVNVKKIQYTTSKKSVASVNKNGRITAKKKGKAFIRAKVTLLNGKVKTVKMRVNVK